MDRSTLLMVIGLLVVIIIAVTVISYPGLDGGLFQENLQGVVGYTNRPPR